jgi:hypothetical protein
VVAHTEVLLALVIVGVLSICCFPIYLLFWVRFVARWKEEKWKEKKSVKETKI